MTDSTAEQLVAQTFLSLLIRFSFFLVMKMLKELRASLSDDCCHHHASCRNTSITSLQAKLKRQFPLSEADRAVTSPLSSGRTAAPSHTHTHASLHKALGSSLILHKF